ncbi:MAG: DUF1800 domain-containing protein [Kineosporiaceae bacterium]|nr:DUF1800 domain-containing protein [Kineosporiaceae bacterium]MBK7624752.1 DUF1800 domain-containing protein [Kineosporiaceae bacterium]MBK8076871.1 DUF1800 domain-containing protein [Kineosporiaceae bacterium]
MPTTAAAELVLSRATYGATPQLRAEIQQLGIPGWLAQQLAPASIPDPEGDAVFAMYPSLSRSMASLQAEFDSGNSSGLDPSLDLQAAHLGRAIWSRRQLFEVMVDFWSNHLNVPAQVDDRATRADYDRIVVRTHALGRFEDLLVASANHPAMLGYLDLANSTGTNPNENYARELLELHTLGVNGGYTEADIKQAAKLLSGWRLDYKTKAVAFDPNRHYLGAVQVVGFTHPNNVASQGPTAARELYEYLAFHPSTAKHLATKLARRFVGDNPPAALVANLASVYLANDTEIVPVLRALFGSAEFAASARSKQRRPMEHLVAAARALGLQRGSDPKALRELNYELSAAGHMPMAYPTPDGYPDEAVKWQSPGQALSQYGAAMNLLHGWYPKGFTYQPVSALLSNPTTATTPAAVGEQLCARFFGRPPAANEATAIATALSGAQPTKPYKPGDGQNVAVSVVAQLLMHSAAFLTR